MLKRQVSGLIKAVIGIAQSLSAQTNPAFNFEGAGDTRLDFC
jgi:hypothetical protein